MSGNNGNSQGGGADGGGGQWHSDGRYATYQMNQGGQGYPTAYPGYPTQDNGLIYHTGGQGAAPPPPPQHQSSSMNAASISHHPRSAYESSSTMNHQAELNSMTHHNSDLASLEYPLHDEQDNSPITTARQSYNQSDL
jgi:hypothetical protein